jgi:hypothetical protein
MKLPNFLHHNFFNSLRAQMGAPLCETLRWQQTFVPIELPDVERLKNQGVEVALNDVEFRKDGTLGYKGHRVLLYIRDVPNYDEHGTLPKFHVAYCATLERMRREQRFQRYVVANRDDGKFQVNLMNQPERSRVVPLAVCQQCMTALDWNNFSMAVTRPERLRHVSQFSLTEFFEKYPRDLVSIRPVHTTDSAPLNDYTADWPDISERVKRARQFECEQCARRLVARFARFLHVHHLNGQKFDNVEGNLQVLCIGCHAEQPMHGHMKSQPEYTEFVQWASSQNR